MAFTQKVEAFIDARIEGGRNYANDVVSGEIVKDDQMGWYPNGTVRVQF